MNQPQDTRSHQQPGQVEHVVELLDALKATDVATAIEDLETALGRLRPAEEIRAELVGVDARTLRAALALRASRARTT